MEQIRAPLIQHVARRGRRLSSPVLTLYKAGGRDGDKPVPYHRCGGFVQALGHRTSLGLRNGHRLYAQHLSADERRRTLRAAQSEPRRRYNVVTNNCEHTVTRALTGDASSRQLESWAVGIGLGALAFALTRRPSLAAAGFTLGASVGPRALQLVRRKARAG